jgi:hypothetical protein
MTCSECNDLISEYLDGEVRGTLRADFLGHVESCSECGSALHGVRAVRMQLADLPRHQLPDAFGFRLRRMLIEESERSSAWQRKLREWFMPSPQTAWAAMSGMVAAAASFALLWMIWMPGTVRVGEELPIKVARVVDEPYNHAQAVRYVLDRLPSKGATIESTAKADTSYHVATYSTPVRVRSVSADF